MEQHSKITQRHPSTGAQPSEQTAENAKNVQQQSNVGGMDELLYRLVENNVSYAGEQFGENLRFNSETLTNVLYDNIRKLLSEKFDSDEFATQVADELLQNGYVLKSSTPEATEQEPQQTLEPKEEIVYTIDEKDYQELLDRINATIVLLQTNRDTILKRISDIGDQVDELGVSIDRQTEVRASRDKQIKELVERIQTNQENVESYIEGHEKLKKEFSERVLGIGRRIDSFAQLQEQRQIQDGKLAIKFKGIFDRAGRNWSSVQKQTEKLREKLGVLGEKGGAVGVSQPPSEPTTNASVPLSYQLAQRGANDRPRPGLGAKPSEKLGRSILSKSSSGREKSTANVPLGKPRRQTISQRIGRRIGVSAKLLKRRVSRSFVGKSYRVISKSVKFVFGIVKGAANAVKKTVTMAWKATKLVTKAFYRASKFTGKLIRLGVKGIRAGVRKLSNTIQTFKKEFKKDKVKAVNNLVVKVMTISPGKMITKMGWRAVKFVGKSIWKGIKVLAFKTLSFFGKFFGMMGKFANKVGHWIGILSHGIVGKTYMFIVKPIASIIVTAFNFASSVVFSPIQFIKWLVPNITDRILGVLSNISKATRNVLKSTWSIFRRILFNPITIALLIGGLFFFLWKWLQPKLSGGIQGIRGQLLSAFTFIGTTALNFLVGVSSALFTVGKFIFDAIDWITKPKGMIAKFVSFVASIFIAVKRGIRKLMKLTGKNNIDILCMFLAGDMIGIALHAITGAMIGIWDWLKKTKFMKLVIGFVKTILAVGKLIFSLGTVLWRSLLAGMWQVAKGNFDGVIAAVVAPWKDLWQQIKGLFSGRPWSDEVSSEDVWERPTEENSAIATRTSVAIRNLKMKGAGTVEDNLVYFNRLQSQILHQAEYGDLLPRMEKMGELYQENARAVGAYDEFLTKTWQMGSGGSDLAQQLLKAMLESPEISQKLLSVFFLYNPQTGETEMLRPVPYIEQFLDNIRKMVSDPSRDDQDAFKTIIEAFDQLNQERSHIVSNQGRVISDFSEKIAKFDQNVNADNLNQFAEIRDLINTFNKGDLFSAATARSSFQQIADHGNAKTRNVKSVTGDTLGTNDLLEVKPIETNDDGYADVKDKDFIMPEEKKSAKPPPDEIENVLFPPGTIPEPIYDETYDDKRIGELWAEHEENRRKYLNQEHTQEEADAVGLRTYTLDEFKQNYKKIHPKSPEQLAQEEENKKKRMAAMRNAKMVSAYHSQGKTASKEGFNFSGVPSIIQIQTDGLSQTLYMFSPEWQKYNNANLLDEDEILLAVDKDNKEAQERMRKKKEAEEAKKREEEAQRRREQQILDYSAKVDGGFIEVKIGEDVDAMRQAWYTHENKRNQFLNAEHTQEEADAVGLKTYTWEEWQRYYRKMHGLPEDGIKRIPFEGKRKERQIDWNARYPMSVEELAQYGIGVSEDGPVMIPLDKAMKAAGSLIANAKTIYSVRDGLEVMRQGLKTETNKLKEQRKEGRPVAVAEVGGGEGSPATETQPPDQSHYPEVG